MYQESVQKLFRKYALPQMAGLLFNSVYVIVDGIFIGLRLGSTAMAAAGLCVPVVELLIALSMAVTSGAGVIISTFIAVNKKTDAVKAFNQCMLLQGIIGLFIAVSGNIWIDPLARFLGADAQTHDLTVRYLFWILTLSPFLLYSYLLGGLVRNDGRPKLAMAALTIGSLSNILLDYVFMYPFNMGISGAALATGIGPVLSCAILLPHFLCRKGILHFQKTPFSGQRSLQFLRFGFPSFIMEFSIGMVTYCMNYGINKYGYGEEGLAAYLIMGYLMLLILTLFLGMSEGLQPVFSYLHAAEDNKKLRQLLKYAGTVYLLTGAAASLAAMFLSLPFYRIFTPSEESLALFAAQKSRLYFCGFAAAGLNILMISFWQACSSVKESLTAAALRGCILPAVLILLLPRFLNRELLWCCHSTAEILTMLLCIAVEKHRTSA